MPVHANFFAGRPHHFLDHKPYQRKGAHGRGVARGVADHDGARAAINCRGVKPFHCFRITAARVLGDIHRIEAKRNRILHGLLGGLQKKVVGPILRKTPNRTGSNKCSGLDRQTRLLHDFGNGTNIVLVGSCRAVGAYLHLLRNDFARQGCHMFHRTRPGTRQSKIKRVDPQRLHQMEDLNFLGNRRIADRWRLQAIAETLIIEQHRPRRLQSRRIILIPVVDEFGSVHGQLPCT